MASDNHLQLYSHKSRREIYGDALESWNCLITYCEETKPQALILAGDIFDDVQPVDVVIRAYVDGMDRLARSQVPVLYIRGQHDMYGVDDLSAKDFMGQRLGLAQFSCNLPSISPHALYMHGQSKEILGRQWYFIDWLPADKVCSGLQAVPDGTDVLVTHQVFKEFSRSGNGSFSDVAHASLTITGDRHEHQSVHYRNREDKMMLVLSPGAASSQAISEEGPFAFYILSLETEETRSGIWKWQSHTYPTREVARVRLDRDLTPEDAARIAKYLKERGPLAQSIGSLGVPIVDVVVRDPVPDLYARLEALTAHGKAHLFWRAHNIEDQVEESNAASRVESVQQTAQEWVIEKEADPSLVTDACRLWDAADAASESLQIYSERLNPVSSQLI